MKEFRFLEDLLGEDSVYEDILKGLMHEKMTIDELHAHIKEEGHTYAKRTLRDKIAALKKLNLITKENEGHTVLYRIANYHYFKSNTVDPLRREAKRKIFDEVNY